MTDVPDLKLAETSEVMEIMSESVGVTAVVSFSNLDVKGCER